MGNNEFNWQEVEYIQKYFTTNVFPVFISGAQKKRILSFCIQANFVPLSLNLFYQQLITLVGFLLIRVLQHIGYHFVTKTGTFVDTRASQAP